jgi:SPOR domain
MPLRRVGLRNGAWGGRGGRIISGCKVGSVLDQRVFKGLGLGVLLLILLSLILYLFWGGRSAPVPTGKLAVKPQTLPSASEAPGTPPPAAATTAPPPGPPPAPPGEGGGISGITPPPPAGGPPAAKEQPMAPLEEETKYGLSVGAFPNFQSAEKMLDRLKQQGTEGFIRRTPGKKKGYQVIAGPFSSKPEAEAAAKSLKSKLHVAPRLATIIIPVSK